jgi:hypothetical protein
LVTRCQYGSRRGLSLSRADTASSLIAIAVAKSTWFDRSSMKKV